MRRLEKIFTHNATCTTNFVIAACLCASLGCGRWSTEALRSPEVMRSIYYRDDGYDPVYDIEYDDSNMPSYDDECIMMYREDGAKRTHKKTAISMKKDTL